MSVNTSEAYRVGIQAFEQFRIGQGLSLVWPPPDTHLNMFIAHLSIKHYKHSTAKSYIAAISFKCKSHTLYDPTKNFVTQKLLQGMRRSTNTADTRLPITLDILQTIIPNLQFVCSSNYETSLYKAAFSLAFHALLRIGEIALSKGNSHETILQCQDVSPLTNKLVVSIKRSKTDQCGRGVTLSVNASHGVTCPVKAMLEFLQVRPSITGPLFCHFSGKPLTRYQFSAVLAKVLAQSSIDSKNFKSHSFRIGAATTLALQGETQHVIQLAGRWQSNAYRTYIR